MATTGIHSLVYTPGANAVCTLFREAFAWDHVDAGEGWLIFATPPAEMAVHPGEEPAHEISLMCDDLEATMEQLRAKDADFPGPVEDQGYGMVTTMRLPGGLEMLLYEPRHPTAIQRIRPGRKPW